MRKKRTKMVCMICGKKMFSLFDNTYTNVDGGVAIDIQMSYGSAFDGNVYRAVLCDECVSKAKEEKKIILKAEGVM